MEMRLLFQSLVCLTGEAHAGQSGQMQGVKTSLDETCSESLALVHCGPTMRCLVEHVLSSIKHEISRRADLQPEQAFLQHSCKTGVHQDLLIDSTSSSPSCLPFCIGLLGGMQS